MDIAEIGRRHLAGALGGELYHLDVDSWKDADGKPVRIYYRPSITGVEQEQIDACSTAVGRTCMSLKLRARNEDGSLIFKKDTLEGMKNDYDQDVVKSIVFFMNMRAGYDQDVEDRQESIEKE